MLSHRRHDITDKVWLKLEPHHPGRKGSQSQNVPIESVMAKVWNNKIFEHINKEANRASELLADERGACPDAEEVGAKERFSNKTSIAPTASISIICGNSSPGIEPYAANSFTQKTLSGSFTVKNKNL